MTSTAMERVLRERKAIELPNKTTVEIQQLLILEYPRFDEIFAGLRLSLSFRCPVTEASVAKHIASIVMSECINELKVTPDESIAHEFVKLFAPDLTLAGMLAMTHESFKALFSAILEWDPYPFDLQRPEAAIASAALLQTLEALEEQRKSISPAPSLPRSNGRASTRSGPVSASATRGRSSRSKPGTKRKNSTTAPSE